MFFQTSYNKPALKEERIVYFLVLSNLKPTQYTHPSIFRKYFCLNVLFCCLHVPLAKILLVPKMRNNYGAF